MPNTPSSSSYTSSSDTALPNTAKRGRRLFEQAEPEAKAPRGSQDNHDASHAAISSSSIPSMSKLWHDMDGRERLQASMPFGFYMTRAKGDPNTRDEPSDDWTQAYNEYEQLLFAILPERARNYLRSLHHHESSSTDAALLDIDIVADIVDAIAFKMSEYYQYTSSAIHNGQHDDVFHAFRFQHSSLYYLQYDFIYYLHYLGQTSAQGALLLIAIYNARIETQSFTKWEWAIICGTFDALLAEETHMPHAPAYWTDLTIAPPLSYTSPLHYAVLLGHSDAVTFLSAHFPGLLNQEDMHAITPLYLAAALNRLPILNQLIEAGVDVTEKTNDEVGFKDMHALNAAAYHGHGDAVNVLLAAGAPAGDCDLNDFDYHWGSALHAAIEGRWPKIAERIIPFADFKSWDGGDDLLPPLHYAAHYGLAGVVQRLIDAGLSLDQYAISDDLYVGGGYPLHVAAQSGHDQVVDVLLAAGAHVAIRDSGGATPLQAAIALGNVPVIQTLLRAGAVPPADFYLGEYGASDSRDNIKAPHIDQLIYAGIFVNPTKPLPWTLKERQKANQQNADKQHSLIMPLGFDAFGKPYMWQAKDNEALLQQLKSQIARYSRIYPNCCDNWLSAMENAGFRKEAYYFRTHIAHPYLHLLQVVARLLDTVSSSADETMAQWRARLTLAINGELGTLVPDVSPVSLPGVPFSSSSSSASSAGHSFGNSHVSLHAPAPGQPATSSQGLVDDALSSSDEGVLPELGFS